MTQLSQTNPAASIDANEFLSFAQAAPGKLSSLQPGLFIESAMRSIKTSPGAGGFAGGFAGAQPFKDTLAFMYVLSCRQDNCMIYVGPQIASLGFTLEDWLGKPDLRMQQVHKDDSEKFAQAMRHSRSTSGAFSCQYRLYDSCGKLRWIHDEAGAVCDKSGAPLFFSGIMLDITDRKEMEAELNEHRYCLERNVERRTEQLVKSMTLLESCNAALCDKLALAQKELATLKQQLAGTLFSTASNDCAEPLYMQL